MLEVTKCKCSWKEWEMAAEPGDVFSSLHDFVTSPEEVQGCHGWLWRFPIGYIGRKNALRQFVDRNQEGRLFINGTGILTQGPEDTRDRLCFTFLSLPSRKALLMMPF